MHNKKAIIAPIFYLLAGLYFICSAVISGATSKDMQFPLTCSIAMLIALIPVFVQAWKGGMEIGEITLKKALRAMGPILMLIAYILLMPVLGSIVCSFLLCMGTVRYLGYRKILGNILFSACIAAFIYAVFALVLRVPLPIGSLWS